MRPNDEPVRPEAEVSFAQADFHAVIPPRAPTAWERRLLEHLLEASGEERLLDQLAEVRVAAECSHCPSIELADGDRILSEPDASHGWRHVAGMHTLVSELEAQDADGIGIWALLFMSPEGYLSELEIQRWDGEPIVARPDPDSFGSPTA